MALVPPARGAGMDHHPQPPLADHQEWWDRTLDTCVVGLLDDRIVAAGKIERQDAWSQADMREQAAGQQAEIGWVLDPSVQGRGLGTAFAAALRDIAVDGLGVRRVEASCFAENLASRRVMEKIGMRLEGTFREESLHRSGRWLDGMSYAQLASEVRLPLSPSSRRRSGRTGVPPDRAARSTSPPAAPPRAPRRAPPSAPLSGQDGGRGSGTAPSRA